MLTKTDITNERFMGIELSQMSPEKETVQIQCPASNASLEANHLGTSNKP